MPSSLKRISANNMWHLVRADTICIRYEILKKKKNIIRTSQVPLSLEVDLSDCEIEVSVS